MHYIPPEYELDPSGSNSSNLISNESHTLSSKYRTRVIAVKKGVYHSNSLIVKDGLGNTLFDGHDYFKVNIHDDVSILYGRELQSLIVIPYDENITSVTLTYQTLGGEYSSHPLTSTADSYQRIFSLRDMDTVDDYRTIQDKESLYYQNVQPINHERKYRVGTLQSRLERLNQAIMGTELTIFEDTTSEINKAYKNIICPEDLEVKPTRHKLVTYDTLIYNLGNRVLSSPAAIWTNNCEWGYNGLFPFFVDTTHMEPGDTLYWEFYSPDYDISTVIPNWQGQVPITNSIYTEIYDTSGLENIEGDVYLCITRQPTGQDFIASTMPLIFKGEGGGLVVDERWSRYFPYMILGTNNDQRAILYSEIESTGSVYDREVNQILHILTY